MPTVHGNMGINGGIANFWGGLQPPRPPGAIPKNDDNMYLYSYKKLLNLANQL